VKFWLHFRSSHFFYADFPLINVWSINCISFLFMCSAHMVHIECVAELGVCFVEIIVSDFTQLFWYIAFKQAMQCIRSAPRRQVTAEAVRSPLNSFNLILFNGNEVRIIYKTSWYSYVHIYSYVTHNNYVIQFGSWSSKLLFTILHYVSTVKYLWDSPFSTQFWIFFFDLKSHVWMQLMWSMSYLPIHFL
jgi:hypothetical protein